MLDTVLLVAPTAGPNGPADFAAATRADLQAIYNTPTGKQLLDSLAAAGRKIYINYGEQNRAGFPFNPKPAFYAADGITPGQGLALMIEYNSFVEKTGVKPWNERPPAIGLAHELIHAEQAAHGRMLRSVTHNPGGPDPENPDKQGPTEEFELEAVGVPPYDTYPVSENKIRAEWNPPQPHRAYY
jgi:type VI secretion system secreted protein VgrG